MPRLQSQFIFCQGTFCFVAQERVCPGPHSISPDTLKILRQAFAKVVADPEVKATAEKQELELDPTEGEPLQAIAKEVVTQPPDVIERMKKLLGR